MCCITISYTDRVSYDVIYTERVSYDVSYTDRVSYDVSYTDKVSYDVIYTNRVSYEYNVAALLEHTDGFHNRNVYNYTRKLNYYFYKRRFRYHTLVYKYTVIPLLSAY